MAWRSDSRTGIAAILAGALIFAGQGGQLVFGDDVPDGVYVACGSAGFVALAVALWGLRDVIAGTRLGRIGIRLALVGVGVLGLFVRALRLRGAWIGLGIALLRAEQQPGPETAPVPA